MTTYGGAKFLNDFGLLDKLFLSIFKADGIYNPFALMHLRACQDDLPFGAVDHHGEGYG